ncbi:hypothetical protein ALP42_05570 [Pseudomonas savastanoi pv. nerii]|uniref:Uncharacterized protein n=1 Tax=Pseudomonas savastanoi pv. nerii TaxID=360921 RepID=A0AB74BIB1_PSESS|nr:hypothetical protein ALP42_05570 [Pseudomonas savastanoi pv. nerii]
MPDQLAACCINVFTARGAHSDVITSLMQQVLKTTDRVIAGTLVTGVRKRVERDQVDLARRVLEQLDHLDGVFNLVVDVLEHGVFNGEHTLFAQTGHVTAAGIKEHLQRVFLVDRHQLVTQRIVRRVQRQGQGNVDMLGKLIDHRYHAGGGQGHPALGNAIPQVIHHQMHGSNDIVEVQQRLTHAHHHHVGDGTVDGRRYAAKGFVGNPHLTDDFGGGEVAVEALLAGGAETAIQGTARLGRNTQGATLALRDIDGLDTAAGLYAHHPFTGAVAGDVLADHFGTANFGTGLELFAQGLADVRHRVEIVDAEVVNPLHDLTGTEALLPDRVEEFLHFLLSQPQQVGFTSRCNHEFTLHSSVKNDLASGYFGSCEEVRDFASGGCFRIGAMNSVGVDGVSEISADGAGSSFFRVGSAHQLTVQSDSVFTFQNLNDNRAGDHEGNQVAEETASAVLSVETFSFGLGQLLQLGSDNAQTGFFETSGDLADYVLGNGVRLDDGESTLNSHGETPEAVIEAKN